MTNSLRALTLAHLLFGLCACHDDDGEPNRPDGGASVFPVTAGDAAPSGADAAPDAPAAQTGNDAASPGPAGGGSGNDGGSPAPDGLPCDVASLLATRCLSCHGSVPLPGIPVSLATHADLVMRSRAFPDQSLAQRALARVQLGTMPPGGGLTPAEVQLLATWVQGGAQPGTCGSSALDAGQAGAPVDASINDAAPAGGDAAPAVDAAQHDTGAAQPPEAGAAEAGTEPDPADGGTPSDASTVDGGGAAGCSSGQRWDGGVRGSALMTPGQPCLSCHAATAPLFSFAGTVFSDADEPDDCFGAVGNGVTVVIEGANGQRLALTPNAAGNFIAAASVPRPYTVEVHYQGRVRTKTQPQTSGDCNGCHTAPGAGGAAGRITLP
jgi:hypothetical protein